MSGFSGIEFSFSVMYSSKRWAVVGVFNASMLILRCLVLIFVLLEEILQRRRALTRLWSESMFAPLNERTSSILEECRRSVSTWSIWFFVAPSGEVHVCLWILGCGKNVLLTTRFLAAAKLIKRIPLRLVVVCKLCLPIVPR